MESQTVSPPQVACGRHAEVSAKLSKDYAEKVIWVGINNNNTITEIFARIGGTFSVVITDPDGLACLVIAGGNWSVVRQKISGIKL